MSAMTTRRRPILGLLAANTISQVGSMLTLIAVPWFVLQTTGSAAKTGLTGVFEALPFIIAGIFGGALVDRLGFKRTSILADITSGLTVALVPLLYHTVGLAFWQLLALAFLGNLFNTPGNTARQSLVPELAAMAGMRLERANSFVQTVPRIATLLGPPLAGVLIAVIGASNVLWLDAATFAISAALIGALIPALITTDVAGKPPGRYFADLMEGLRFIWNEPLIRALSILFAVGNFLDAPIGLLFSVYAIRTYHSAVPVGLTFAALGGGAVIGSLWFGAVGHRLSRRAIFIFYCIPVAGMYATFAFTPPLAVLVIAVFIDGLAVGPVNPLSATIRQERVPVALRGRVQGMGIAISFMMIPLGRGLAGLLIDPIGLRTIFLSIAGSFLLISLAVALAPIFRNMETPGTARHIAPGCSPTPRRVA
ncbi:MAG: MFS transporter [Thermomicrobiales bacterium]